LAWWAWKSEKWIFHYLNIFSLPSIERKRYFNMEELKGKFFFLPNYPSKKIYKRVSNSKKEILNNIVNISFQGAISEGHGFEEIIKYVLPCSKYDCRLFLRGYVSESYKCMLTELAATFNIEEKLFFSGFLPYSKLIHLNDDMNIGIAIYKKKDVMNSTIATASNKIYEYAASGMAVLLFDNEHFRETLKDKP
jgi:hypothetical protein